MEVILGHSFLSSVSQNVRIVVLERSDKIRILTISFFSISELNVIMLCDGQSLLLTILALSK